MKKKVRLNLVTGDENLVTSKETYVAFDSEGNITAFKQRNDAGELTTTLEPVSGSSDYPNMYLTFKALENSTFSLTSNSTETRVAQYSLDGGRKWKTLTAGTDSLVVRAGKEVCWKANLTVTTGIGTFQSTGYFEVYGNIMSLTHGDEFREASSMEWSQFSSLFKDATKLKTAANLILPSTMANDCYEHMFEGCSSLIAAPELPAKTLSSGCYRYMFKGCSSLLECPDLPATTLNNNCYQEMFSGCTSLVKVPTILPATLLVTSCYYQMFGGCTKITTAPILPAPRLAQYCYAGMFMDCNSLTYIKCLAVNKTATQCTNWWVPNVAATGTFVKAENATWETGSNGIPAGWTVENATD